MATKKNKGFWQDMLSGTNGGVSSKRVIGMIVVLVLLVVIVVNTFVGADNHWLGEAFITMEVGGFSLLGIGIFEKRLKNINDKKEDKDPVQQIQQEDEFKEFNEDC